MTGRVFSGLAALCLAACTAEPRSAEFFADHSEEAARVSAQCATGAKGGDECVNAQAGIAAARREERMNAYRREF